MSQREFKSFSEFWPYYLGEHSRPATRVLHYIGSLAAIAVIIAVVAVGRWWL
ncbi:MAG: Mpo1-like protein, partial [Pyrinomonadaceae bacterium]